MTSEEIKKTITMPDLLSRYGIEIKHDMCRCAFHGKDRHPSMKVFKDGANCFTCGWNGDVFRFYMDMEHVDFKTAFKALGGSYKRSKTLADKVNHSARLEASKSNRERERTADEKLKQEISEAMRICEIAKDSYEPLSDGWCFAVNSLQYLQYKWESKYINEEEIEELYVHRKCRQIRQYFL